MEEKEIPDTYISAHPEDWYKAAEAISTDLSADRRKRFVTIILGAPDTGKTALARFLIEEWCSSGIKVALVDGDMGQSTLGPPTTIGMALFKTTPNWIEDIQPVSMRFVGSTSPEGYLLTTVVGIKKLTERAFTLGAEIVLVDTTGLVTGSVARQLKYQKIDLLSPRHILALQREGEIEHLLAPYERCKMMELHRLIVSERTKVKTREQRRTFRELRFKDYFCNGKPHTFPLGLVRLWNEEFNSLKEVRGLLVGLCDERGEALAIGIIEAIDFGGKNITIFAPLTAVSKVRSIHLGGLLLDSGGRELGKTNRIMYSNS